MTPFELGETKPDHPLVNGDVRLCSQEPGHLCDARLAIAMAPHPCRGLVQAVGLVPLEIVDKNLVRQRFDDQTLGARQWFLTFYSRPLSGYGRFWKNRPPTVRKEKRSSSEAFASAQPACHQLSEGQAASPEPFLG